MYTYAVGRTPMLVADAMRMGGRYIEVDAVVAGSGRTRIGIVRACIDHNGELFVAVAQLAVSSQLGKAVYCEPAAGPLCELWRADGTEPCLAWKRCSRSGSYTIVTP